jgi:hypothetical protein
MKESISKNASQNIYEDSKLLVPVVYFATPVQLVNGLFGRSINALFF